MILLSISSYTQTYTEYRVVAHSNPTYLGTDTFPSTVVSISNTVSVQDPFTLYIPTIFSPDGDGVNDEFNIKGDGFDELTFEIYNRWGQIVFQSEDMETGWDGRFQNKDSPIGTYVYRILIRNLAVRSGTVTLVR